VLDKNKLFAGLHIASATRKRAKTATAAPPPEPPSEAMSIEAFELAASVAPLSDVPTSPHFYGQRSDAEVASALAESFSTQAQTVPLSPRAQKRHDDEQRLMREHMQALADEKQRMRLYDESMRRSSASAVPPMTFDDEDSDVEEVRRRGTNAQRRNEMHANRVRAPNGGGTAIPAAPAVTMVPIEKIVPMAPRGAAPPPPPPPLWTSHSGSKSTMELQRSSYVGTHQELSHEAQLALALQSTLNNDSGMPFPFLFDLCSKKRVPSSLPRSGDAFRSIRPLARDLEEEFLRTRYEHELDCVEGTHCIGLRLGGKGYVLVQFPPEKVLADYATTHAWSEKVYPCVLCLRYHVNYAHFSSLPDCKPLSNRVQLSNYYSLMTDYHLQDLVFSSSQDFRGTVHPFTLMNLKKFMPLRDGSIVRVHQIGYLRPNSECASFFETGLGSLKRQREQVMLSRGATRALASRPRHLSIHPRQAPMVESVPALLSNRSSSSDAADETTASL